MPDVPRRYKEQAEMSVDELVRHQQNGKQVETDEYRKYKRDILIDAGLNDEADELDDQKSDADKSADEHFQHIRRGGH